MENFGVRGSNIKIKKKDAFFERSVDLNLKLLMETDYIGDSSKCSKLNAQSKRGFFLICPNSRIACSKLRLNLSNLNIQNHQQLVIFKHFNLKGTYFRTLAFLESMPNVPEKILDPSTFLINKFSVNPMAQNIADLDPFAKNFLNFNYSLQTLKTNQNLIVCMVGNLFNKNSLIQGVKVFNFFN